MLSLDYTYYEFLSVNVSFHPSHTSILIIPCPDVHLLPLAMSCHEVLIEKLDLGTHIGFSKSRRTSGPRFRLGRDTVDSPAENILDLCFNLGKALQVTLLQLHDVLLEQVAAAAGTVAAFRVVFTAIITIVTFVVVSGADPVALSAVVGHLAMLAIRSRVAASATFQSIPAGPSNGTDSVFRQDLIGPSLGTPHDEVNNMFTDTVRMSLGDVESHGKEMARIGVDDRADEEEGKECRDSHDGSTTSVEEDLVDCRL